MTIYPEIKIFEQYLDPEKKYEFPMSEQGLVSDAPPEAVKAYEDYKAKIKRSIELEKEIGLYL